MKNRLLDEIKTVKKEISDIKFRLEIIREEMFQAEMESHNKASGLDYIPPSTDGYIEIKHEKEKLRDDLLLLEERLSQLIDIDDYFKCEIEMREQEIKRLQSNQKTAFIGFFLVLFFSLVVSKVI